MDLPPRTMISVALLVLLTFLILSGSLQPYDMALTAYVNSLSGYHPIDALMRTITEAGNPLFWISLSFLHFLLSKRKSFPLIISLALAMLVSQLLLEFIRVIYPRPRPFLDPNFDIRLHEEPPSTPSFPSGHATRAFSGGFLLAAFQRSWLPALIVLSVLVGFSRVYLGLHHASDVAGGALLGYLVAKKVQAIVTYAASYQGKRAPPSSPVDDKVRP